METYRLGGNGFFRALLLATGSKALISSSGREEDWEKVEVVSRSSVTVSGRAVDEALRRHDGVWELDMGTRALGSTLRNCIDGSRRAIAAVLRVDCSRASGLAISKRFAMERIWALRVSRGICLVSCHLSPKQGKRALGARIVL